MSADLLTVIRQARPRLSTAEAAVATVVIDDPGAAVAMSIGTLAAASGVGPATVARFCQAVGYSGYRAFRLALAAAMSREEAERDHFDASGADVDPSDTIEDVVTKVAFQEVQAIQHTARAIDLATLDEAAGAVSAAQRVDIVGFGSSGLTAADLQLKLSRIGFNATSSIDAHVALPSAALLDATAVAIGISHSGLTVETNQALEIARDGGARTIAITNYPDSPLAAVADLVLTTQARESRFRSGAMSSRIAQLALIDMLFVRVAQNRYDQISEALRRTYQAVQDHRLSQPRRRVERW